MTVVIVVFNLVLYLNFWFNLVSQFFKMIQFLPFQFETKLVTKFNYNLYIHVKIIVLNLYIMLELLLLLSIINLMCRV